MQHLTTPGIGSKKLTESDFTSGATDIFTSAKTVNTYLNEQEVIYTADNLPDPNGPYKINIVGNAHQYIKPNSFFLEIKLQMLKKDGTKATRNDQIYPVVNIAPSLFESIMFEINNVTVSELTQNHFPYSHYIQTLFSFGSNAGKSHLIPRLFIPDKAKAFESAAWKTYTSLDARTNEEKNNPFAVRHAMFFHNEDHYRIYMPIGIDWLQSKHLIPPNTSIKMTFKRTDPEFYLLSPDAAALNYNIRIADMKMHVTYVTLEPEIKKYHDDLFSKGNHSIMEYQKIEVTTKQFPSGLTELAFDNFIAGGVEPKQIVIGLVKTKSFDGDKKTSPFTFAHCNVRKAYLRRNNTIFPNEPATYDFAKNDLIVPYVKFLKNIGFDELDDACIITLQNFKEDSTFFTFDLTPDNCNSYHHHGPSFGNIDIKLELTEPTTDAMTMIVMHSYDKSLTFSPIREVTIHNH